MEEKRSRHRLPISCVQCRRRKRKCDRQNPCQTCIHRGEAEHCSYESPSESLDSVPLEDVRSDNQALQERVRNLETLVQEYARRSGASAPVETYFEPLSYSRPSPELPSSPNHLLGPGTLAGQGSVPQKSTRAQGCYKSLTSWDHILRELDELKIAVGDTSFDPAYPAEGIDLDDIDSGGMFFAPPGRTFQSISMQLPPRHQMDALLSQYLNSYHPFYPIINPTKFREEYKSFLSQPDDPVMLSLLFGMMSLAIANNDPTDVLADRYIKLSLQALQVSRFTTTFNLTTVVCLINIIFFLQRERYQQTFTWILFGCTLQIARALGLHRDPSHFGITGQACQTRRHIWTALLTQDAIYAGRYGRTTVIDTDEWDSKSPDHLNEDGYRVSDQMPACYAHAKRVVAITIERLFKTLFRPRARPSYQTVLDVEQDIRVSHDSLARKINDAAIKTSSNYQAIQWLYTKFSPFIMAYTLVIIHRPFMVRKSPEFLHSRMVCLDSARTMIDMVSEMQTRTGMEHWAWHVRECCNIAYVPAATLLCVGLHIRNNADFAPLPQAMDNVDPDMDHRRIQHVLSQLKSETEAIKIVRDLYSKVCDHSSNGVDAMHLDNIGTEEHEGNVMGGYQDWGSVAPIEPLWRESLSSNGSGERNNLCVPAQNPEVMGVPYLRDAPAPQFASTFHAHQGNAYQDKLDSNNVTDHMWDRDTTGYLASHSVPSVGTHWEDMLHQQKNDYRHEH